MREERGGVFAAAFCRLSVRASDVGRSRYGRRADKPRAHDGQRHDTDIPQTQYRLAADAAAAARRVEDNAPCRGRTAARVDARPPMDGCATDYPRTYHGRASGRLRTSHGLATGGHLSDADNLRHAEMGGGARWTDLRRASRGLVTDWTRTGDGLLMGGHLSDADNLRHAEMGGAADLPTGF